MMKVSNNPAIHHELGPLAILLGVVEPCISLLLLGLQAEKRKISPITFGLSKTLLIEMLGEGKGAARLTDVMSLFVTQI